MALKFPEANALTPNMNTVSPVVLVQTCMRMKNKAAPAKSMAIVHLRPSQSMVRRLMGIAIQREKSSMEQI